MNEWNFVMAAYALTGIAIAWLGGASWFAMRRAEDAAEAARGK